MVLSGRDSTEDAGYLFGRVNDGFAKRLYRGEEADGTGGARSGGGSAEHGGGRLFVLVDEVKM